MCVGFLRPISRAGSVECPAVCVGSQVPERVDRLALAVRVSSQTDLPISTIRPAVAVSSARIGGAEGAGPRRAAGRDHETGWAARHAPQFCDASPGRRVRHSNRLKAPRASGRPDNEDLLARDGSWSAGGEESGRSAVMDSRGPARNHRSVHVRVVLGTTWQRIGWLASGPAVYMDTRSRGRVSVHVSCLAGVPRWCSRVTRSVRQPAMAGHVRADSSDRVYAARGEKRRIRAASRSTTC
jgi:hypothetical protein